MNERGYVFQLALRCRKSTGKKTHTEAKQAGLTSALPWWIQWKEQENLVEE